MRPIPYGYMALGPCFDLHPNLQRTSQIPYYLPGTLDLRWLLLPKARHLDPECNPETESTTHLKAVYRS